MKCAICGTEFEAPYPWQKYCSHECYKKARHQKNRQYQKKYRETHREQYLEYQREYLRKYREEHYDELKVKRIKRELAK